MAQQKVELRKIRDFSDNLNDTFLFIRQNLKPLLTSFLGIAGIFMLLAAIFSGMFQASSGNVFEQIVNGTRVTPGQPFGFLTGTYFLVLLFAWMNITAMQVVIVAYMKAYAEKGESPTIDEVWRLFRKYYIPLFFYSLPNLILIIIGYCLCIFPGIFLTVVLIPFKAVVMMEDLSYGAAFSRCFQIVKNNFWISLAIYFLVYLIYAFSAGIISLVIGATAGLIYYFTTKNISGTVGFVTSVLSIFSYLFYIIFFVSVVLNYFNLTERLDGTGIMMRLNSIGDNSNNFDNIQEEY